MYNLSYIHFRDQNLSIKFQKEHPFQKITKTKAGTIFDKTIIETYMYFLY